MDRTTQLICASVLVGTLMALAWFNAPIAPAVIGATGAGLVLYLRRGRAVP